MPTLKAWAERHPLSTYFTLAYLCSWSIAVPLALQGQGIVSLQLPWSLHYLTAFGQVNFLPDLNFVSASPNASGLVAAVTSTLVMAWAVGLVWRNRTTGLGQTSGPTRSVRADRLERTRALPGDELIPEPIGMITRAVTIRRPPHDVWPWLAQMGAGSRAGWYSYDFIDNGRRPSSERVVPELQTLAAGMVFPALPGMSEGFIVQAFQPDRFLVLGWPSKEGRRLTTWAFVLEAMDDNCTRLIVRSRAGRGYSFHRLPLWTVRLIHFVMERKQLLGIARRVEASAPAPGPELQDDGAGRPLGPR